MPPEKRETGGKGKSLRLKFKGDSDPRKRRKHKHTDHAPHSSHNHLSAGRSKRRTVDQGGESDAEQYGGDEQAWVPIQTVTDLHGPTFIFVYNQGTCYALGLDKQHSVSLIPVSSDPDSGPAGGSAPSTVDAAQNTNAAGATSFGAKEQERAEAEALLASTDHAGASIFLASDLSMQREIEPTSVYQVWVATRVAGSESWNLRSAESKFLSCLASGQLRAEAVSRGPLESWTPSLVPIAPKAEEGSSEPSESTTTPGTSVGLGIRLQSSQGPWLRASWPSSSTSGSGGHLKASIAADADVEEDGTVFHVKVQWKHRHFARGEQAKKNYLQSRVGQAEGPGGTDRSAPAAGTILYHGEVSSKTGYKSAEAAVDARARVKSDKYAK